jgi:uncharacterized protein YyaL (SSP411 family)
MEQCINKFWDKEAGGFFDTEEEVVGTRLKGVEDVPHPSANSLAIILLLKLSFMQGNAIYRQYAEKTLKAFVTHARVMGVHAGYYFCALDAFFNLAELTIHTSPDSKLAQKTLSIFYPYTGVLYKEEKGCVVPCIRNICHEPVNNPAELKNILTAKNKPIGQ